MAVVSSTIVNDLAYCHAIAHEGILDPVFETIGLVPKFNRIAHLPRARAKLQRTQAVEFPLPQHAPEVPCTKPVRFDLALISDQIKCPPLLKLDSNRFARLSLYSGSIFAGILSCQSVTSGGRVKPLQMLLSIAAKLRQD